MPKLNGKAPPDALEELDEVIRELEGSAWDEISEVTENHIHIHAPIANMETKPDHPRPKQESLPEKVIDAVPEVLDRTKTWPQALVASVIVVSLAALAAAWLIYG